MTLSISSLASDVNGTWMCTHDSVTAKWSSPTIPEIKDKRISFTQTITSETSISWTVTYGCINIPVYFTWFAVDDSSQHSTTLDFANTADVNSSLCTTYPGFDAYTETHSSSSVTNLGGSYRIGVEVHYLDEATALQSIQYFNTSFVFSSGGTSTSTDNNGRALVILFVCLLVAYCIVVAGRFCAGSTKNTSGNCFLTFCQFIEERFFDCCGCERSQESEDDPGFFKDKVCTLNSLLGFTYLVLYGVIVEVIILLAVYYGSDKFQEVLVIGVGFVIVLVLSFLCLLVVVRMLMKFVNNGASRSPSFIRNGTVTPQNMGKSQKKATVDKRQQPDGDEGPQSIPKDPDARHLTIGRPLPRRPDIASPQTGSFDSVNSARSNVLAPIENPNILPSMHTLDEQKTDKKPKDKKKKKKKRKDEGQDNPAYVQDNNVLT